MHWLVEVWVLSAIVAGITCYHIGDLKHTPDARFACLVLSVVPVVNTVVAFCGIVVGLCTLTQVVLTFFAD